MATKVDPAVTFDRELAAFDRKLPTLLADPATRGKFALLGGGDIAGIFNTADAALAAGHARFGPSGFKVLQVMEQQMPADVAERALAAAKRLENDAATSRPAKDVFAGLRR